METNNNQNQNQNTQVTKEVTKEKVNKVSAKKAISQSKANASILDKITALRSSGVIAKGMKGQNVDLYKKELFAGLFDDQKKQVRKQLRKIRDGFFLDILSCKDKTKLQKLCKEFYTWYVDIYTVNDFSVNSVCSGRTDENTKNLCEKALQIIKQNVGK